MEQVSENQFAVSEDELINGAIAALDPNSSMGDEDRKAVLSEFENAFGEGSVHELTSELFQNNPGDVNDGRSDSIPAEINGSQPAALSDGEYVIPADVVSGLGNGSTDAGVKRLEEMIATIRQETTGTPEQPPVVDAGGVLGGLGGR